MMDVAKGPKGSSNINSTQYEKEITLNYASMLCASKEFYAISSGEEGSPTPRSFAMRIEFAGLDSVL